MKRVFVILLILCASLMSPSIAPRVQAQVGYAECDVCGYCQGQTAPENWSWCAQCRYPEQVPNAGISATTNVTLALNSETQSAIKPKAGTYYTQLGCLDTGVLSFRDNPAAIGAAVNFILTRFLFPTAGTLAFGGIVFGAFLLLTAQGEQEKILRGRRLVMSSIVGAVFTFSSVFIINFIAGDVLKIPGFARGTKVTFVGYGSSAKVDGIETYPELTVYLDGKEVGKIQSIQGTGPGSNPQSYEVNLPAKLDLSTDADVRRVTMKFTNDLCLTRQNSYPGQCCYYQWFGATKIYVDPFHPYCEMDPKKYSGDRNIWNTRILFNDRICAVRRNSNGDTSNTDGTALRNYWRDVTYSCSALAP